MTILVIPMKSEREEKQHPPYPTVPVMVGEVQSTGDGFSPPVLQKLRQPFIHANILTIWDKITLCRIENF